MDTKNYIIVFVALFSMSKYDATNVKMTNAHCESFNKSWVVFSDCRLKALSRNLTVLNINADFLHPANDIYVQIELKRRENGYKPFLFNIKIDGCQFMRKHNNPVAKILLSLIKEFSTVNHTCPYVGKQMVKGFYFKPERLHGLPFPSGDYLLLLTWIFGKTKTFVTNVYYSFME